MDRVQSRSGASPHRMRSHASWPSATSAVELLRPLALPSVRAAAAAAAAASGRPRSMKRRKRQVRRWASKGSSASDRRLSSDSSAVKKQEWEMRSAGLGIKSSSCQRASRGPW